MITNTQIERVVARIENDMNIGEKWMVHRFNFKGIYGPDRMAIIIAIQRNNPDFVIKQEDNGEDILISRKDAKQQDEVRINVNTPVKRIAELPLMDLDDAQGLLDSVNEEIMTICYSRGFSSEETAEILSMLVMFIGDGPGTHNRVSNILKLGLQSYQAICERDGAVTITKGQDGTK